MFSAMCFKIVISAFGMLRENVMILFKLLAVMQFVHREPLNEILLQGWTHVKSK